MVRVGLVPIGIACITITIIGFVVPIFGEYSYLTRIEFCVEAEITFGKMLSLIEKHLGVDLEDALLPECKNVTSITLGLIGLASVGTILIIVGAVRSLKSEKFRKQ